MTGPLRRMTFRSRLLAIVMGGLGLALILSFLFALIYARGTLRESLLKDLRTQVQVLSESVSADLDFGTVISGSKSISAFMTNPEIVAVKVLDKDGGLFAAEARPGVTLDFSPGLPRPEGHAFSGGYLELVSEIRHEGQKKGTLYLRASLAQIQDQFRKAVWALFFQSFALLLVLFFIGVRVLRGISDPILELASTARQVSTTHDYSLRMTPVHEGEVGTLARSFNDMLEHIQQQDRRLSDQIRMLDEELAERRRIEAELRVSEQRLAMALESTGEGVWDWLVREGTIQHNARWCRILGLPDECHQQTEEEFLQRVHEEDLAMVRDRLRACFVETDTLHAIYRMRRTDGAEIWVESRGRVVERDSLGNPLRLVGRTVDVTELRKAEEGRRELELELHHLQRLESVGRLAGGVAHDMNNVLGAIMAVASLLEDRHPSDPAVLKNARSILGAAERGRDLVRGLLEFARKDLQAPTALDLNELVRKEAELLRSTTLKKVGIELELQESIPRIMGEASALSNVLMNLCVNAVDAMPRGGRLRLRTLSPSPGVVELVVEDNGHGMTPEVKHRALEPFFTTKPAGKGTGLGLAVVFGTVKAHGGSLEIESEPGKGTQVRIQLLAVGEGRKPDRPPNRPDMDEPTALSLLLVDDDIFIQESVPRLLEACGHRVEVAKDGMEGLTRLEAGPLPDLVILDMNMPGLSGLDTLRRLRERYASLPVVFGSGFMDADLMQSLAEFSHVQPLPKPYSRREIQSAIRAAMGG